MESDRPGSKLQLPPYQMHNFIFLASNYISHDICESQVNILKFAWHITYVLVFSKYSWPSITVGSESMDSISWNSNPEEKIFEKKF